MKGREFILTLWDYFQEKFAEKTDLTAQGVGWSSTDKWAFKFIDAPYLQPILEAIDDNASGYIRVSELNDFIASKPKDWRYGYLTLLYNVSSFH